MAFCWQKRYSDGGKKWTPQQQDAISARGGSILVSAAAGSGKTAVLVERILQKISDPKQACDISRLLVLTYSNAAARQMKERLQQALTQKIQLADPEQKIWLKRQQILAAQANICTIHAFCLQLIRQHFSALDISPDFRVAEESELQLLRQQALAETAEEFYQKGEEDGFYRLAELTGGGRDDRKLLATIEAVYDFVRSHPFPFVWLEQKQAMYACDQINDSIWVKSILSYTADALEYASVLLGQAIRQAGIYQQLVQSYLPALESDLSQIQAVQKFVQAKQYLQIRERLQQINYQRFSPLRGFEEEDIKENIKLLRQQAKTIVSQLQKRCFSCSGQDFSEDMEYLRPAVEALFSAVRSFYNIFEQKKKERNCVDFSDIEQYALTLLVKPAGNGYEKTAAAQETSRYFDEILIDEYQDTNQAQDMIFRALSKEENNLFMVGDVKQSIYRFRQAQPEIFIAKKRSFAPYDGQTFPAKILLGKNFRSREEITQSVNYIFSAIMSEKLGEIIYNREEELVCGAAYPASPDTKIELALIDTQPTETLPEQAVDKTAAEAAWIAKHISDMLEQGEMIAEGDALRPCEAGDFCILLRSVKGKATIYAKELAKLGINAYCEAEGGYFQAREVHAVLNFLYAIDNPLQDIPLIGALLSDIFAFTPDDIAKIRLAAPKTSFYNALRAYAANYGGRAAEFLRTLDFYRRLSVSYTADRFILRFLEDSGYLSMVSAMKNGKARRANLHRLVSMATKYESSGYRGLSSFLRFVRSLMEKDIALPGGESANNGGNAVHIMSIHKSKGLEFPICFVADLKKNFNKQDLNNASLLHSELGFGCLRRDMQQMKQYQTLPYQAIRLEKEREMLCEEMRVFYVALTRAKEKLVFTVCDKDIPHYLTKLAFALDGTPQIPPYIVRSKTSFSDWLLLALLRHNKAKDLRTVAGIEENVVVKADFDLDILFASPLPAVQEKEVQHCFIAKPDAGLCEKIEDALQWRYPYEQLSRIPSKLSVSALAHQDRMGYEMAKRPSFMFSGGLSGSEKGTALHKFMQFSDYEKARQDIAGELQRLLQQRFITEEEKKNIPVKALEKFFSSSTAQDIFSSPSLLREFKFFIRLQPQELFQLQPPDKEEYIVVQGVADCIYEKEGGMVILDYKTDHADEETLLKQYSSQLQLYSRAVEEVLGKEVNELTLYSFHLGKAIAVPKETIYFEKKQLF